MNTCPCCSSKLLCHISYKRIYWFCSSCGQEMPNFNTLPIVNVRKSFNNFTPKQNKTVSARDLPKTHV
jgi:ribosomal protein L37AE/L43A